MPEWLAWIGAASTGVGLVLLLWSRLVRPAIRFLYIMERATPILESMVRHFDKVGPGNGGTGFDRFMQDVDDMDTLLDEVAQHDSGDEGHPPINGRL